MPEVREKLTAMDSIIVASTPEQFGACTRAKSSKWAALIVDAAITAQ